MKETELQSWARPHWKPGGGEAFLFYVVFGDFQSMPTLSRRKYRSAGPPAAVDVMRYSDETNAEVRDDFRAGYLWDVFQQEQADLAGAVGQAPQCIVLRGELGDSPTLNYMRDVVGLMTCLLDNGGIAIFDPQMFQWWSPDDFRTQIFEPAAPEPGRHVSILKSDDEEHGMWLHTRGMRKFGRPDVSVRRVASEHEKASVDLISRLIQAMAQGMVFDDGAALSHNDLPEGITCHHGGHLEDPDFNNVHLEVRWPS